MSRLRQSPLLKKIMAHREQLLWGAFLFLGLCAALYSVSPKSEKREDLPDEPASLETFIPKGHLLIPVEVANADRLEGVLGQNGVVDLYQPAENPGGRAKLVGKRLRMLRAPMNPMAFAVLLRDAEVDQFLTHQGPFIASVRPLTESAHELRAKSRQVSRPRIDYHQESL